jgi:tRNA-specific 2-thiouridylase
MSAKVLVGMSGGIDSSVSAYRLQKDGFEVSGVYMKLHNASKEYHEKNIKAGKSVAEFLGIDYHVLDLTEDFNKEVYSYFVDEYKNGRTPNPCVKCNRTIKFGAMLDFAKSIGCEYLATGHYAKNDGEFIYEATDDTKDQSYFLAQVEKDVLKHLIFPMANCKKEDIVNEAKNIPVLKEISKNKESQEICFVDTVYTDILKKHHDIEKEGDVLDIDGKKIGHHKGYMHYTIGKRKGFYVHGAHDPHYVKALDPKNNTITVSKKEELGISGVYLSNLNMYSEEKEFECEIKLRYRSIKTPCIVNIKDDIAHIKLKEKVYGVANGQVGVFYDGDKVIGSGWISDTYEDDFNI